MEKGKREAVTVPREKRAGRSKLPLIILGCLVAAAAAGYVAVCAVAAGSGTIFPNVSAVLPDLVVGGMTKDEARSYLEQELPGAMDNRALMEYYSREPVSCLVNVSSSEGLPVSLMEAASFGFPALATAVGGTPEALR